MVGGWRSWNINHYNERNKSKTKGLRHYIIFYGVFGSVWSVELLWLFLAN